MLLLPLLAATQSPYTPEIEALLRRRDDKRRQETQAQVLRKEEAAAFSGLLPPEIAQRLTACLAKADVGSQAGLDEAAKWAGEGGGAHAAHCKGYALGKAQRFAEAAAAFEAGGRMAGTDAVTRARLWSQAGNAALVAGDVPRALADFDQALEQPLPATLSTGEIHLDRARARVAAEDVKGARDDLDKALQMAPADPLGWLLSATLARRTDDLAMARAHIEQAAKLSRNDPNIALEQGVIYALSGDRDPAARAAFQRAEQTAGGDEALVRKARAYLAQLPPEPAPATPAGPPDVK